MKNAIPKSKAKTAYGLLSEVKALILAEPKRYNQGLFIMHADEQDATTYMDKGDFPLCGTVGCVAGWVATLKRKRRFSYDAASEIAERALGLTPEQADQLFDGEVVAGEPGTVRYAKRGAAHIARFQKRYAAQLKATRV